MKVTYNINQEKIKKTKHYFEHSINLGFQTNYPLDLAEIQIKTMEYVKELIEKRSV